MRERLLLTIIPFGYPTHAIGEDVEKDRKRLSQVAHAEVYGRPYEG